MSICGMFFIVVCLFSHKDNNYVLTKQDLYYEKIFPEVYVNNN